MYPQFYQSWEFLAIREQSNSAGTARRKSKVWLWMLNWSKIIAQILNTCIAITPEPQNGKICYEDVLHLLTCPTCESHVSTPVIQCKRGHLSCEDCSRQQQECPICHQSWMDGPNVILDKVINLIALPCKYGYKTIVSVLCLNCIVTIQEVWLSYHHSSEREIEASNSLWLQTSSLSIFFTRMQHGLGSQGGFRAGRGNGLIIIALL